MAKLKKVAEKGEFEMYVLDKSDRAEQAYSALDTTVDHATDNDAAAKDEFIVDDRHSERESDVIDKRNHLQSRNKKEKVSQPRTYVG